MTIFKFIFFMPLLFSCSQSEQGFKEDKNFIGGQKVTADVLSHGKQVYLEYCMACHGLKGDGNGPAAKGSFPPPRNFTQGLYKFALTADSGLPTDADFHRIIKNGLHGTGMLAWDMSDQQIHAVTQYIKTFAPQVWENKDTQTGKPIEVFPDPYGLARKKFAIEKGKEVYHLVANCQSCHRAYISQDEFSTIYKKYNNGQAPGDFDATMYELKMQESEYYFFNSKERLMKILPPDFTWHEIRSANNVEELYLRIAAGVTGTGMPAWRGVLTEDEIWALAYYVKDLTELRNSPKRADLIKAIGR